MGVISIRVRVDLTGKGEFTSEKQHTVRPGGLTGGLVVKTDSTAGGADLIPGLGTKIPYAIPCSQNF